MFVRGVESWSHVNLKHLGVLRPSGVKSHYIRKRIAESVTIRNKFQKSRKRKGIPLTNSSIVCTFDDLIKSLKPTKK
jgi:hypothetical protein